MNVRLNAYLFNNFQKNIQCIHFDFYCVMERNSVYIPDNISEPKFTREIHEFVNKGFENAERIILKQMIFSILILCFRALEGNCVYSKRKVPTRA
jgi:hypothetical protein